MPKAQDQVGGGPLSAHQVSAEAEGGDLPDAQESIPSPAAQGTERPRRAVEIDMSEWQLDRHRFLRYHRLYGPFDLDGASDNAGANAHVTDFCCPDRSFLETDFSGRNVYLHAPYDQLESFLAHYLRTKLRAPSTRGVFIVPKWTRKPWFKLLRNFTLVEEIPADQPHVFTRPAGQGTVPTPGGVAADETQRVSLDSTPWPTLVFVDNSDTVRFLPQRLRAQPDVEWTHAKVLVTDGQRALLVREQDGTYWFPGGKRDPTDATPLDTAVRETFEEAGVRLQPRDFEFLGRERPTRKPYHRACCWTYALSVRPAQLDGQTVDTAKWVTWDELVAARRDGKLPCGAALRFDGFGTCIDDFINHRGVPSVSVNVTAADRGGKLLTVQGTLCGQPANILIDSGASLNYVNSAWTEDHPEVQQLLQRGTKYRVRQADGSRTTASMQLQSAALKVGLYDTTVNALSTKLGNWDLILGQPWLTSENPDIDWETHVVRRRVDGQPLFAGASYEHPISVSVCDASTLCKHARKRNCDIFVATLRELNDAEADESTDDDSPFAQELKTKLAAYKDITDEPTGLPPRREWDFGIELESDVPPKQCTYRMSPAELQEVRRQLTDMLERGWIRPSTSQYGAPILFARKKDGSLRMCVDYRKLNDVTRKNRTPLPRIDELLDSLHGATVFSSLDLYKGYHQIRVKDEDIHKTAFRTHYGLYEFTVLSFGLTNAPAGFQTMMNSILAPYLGRFCVVYLDDILIYSKDEQEHLRHVELILQKLREHKLHVNLKKCAFGKTSVEFLGHIVEAGHIRMDPRKVQAVRDWPTPSSVTEVRAFLGLAGYYRRFIHRFSARAAPLTDLTKKSTGFQWGTSAQAAFEDIKTAMTEAPVLLIPDTSPDAKYTLYTDASGFAVGAVLLQDQGRGLQPVCFHARKMNKHECNYPVHEQELLGVVDALRAFRCYLEGSAGFTCITDHNSLRYFFTQRELSRRQVRWYQTIAPFQRQMDIVYKRGATNHADALSRRADLKDALTRLQLISDIDCTEEELEEEAYNFAMEASLLDNQSLLAAIRAGYKQDSYYSGKLPEWLHQRDDGIFIAYDNRIAIPANKELRRLILYELHDAPTRGHPGRDKLMRLATRHFWWPHMSRSVDQYVRSCPTCQRTKKARHKPYGLLQPHDAPDRPWEVVSLDLITDLPTCEGYDSVVVFVDLLTKMAIFEPCNKTITAAGLAKLFQRQVFRRHGIPTKLVSDRDPRFISNFWQSLFRSLGTKLNISTSHHPQTDGQTERTNQTLEQIVRCYVHPLHDDWMDYLCLAEFAYNSQVASSTNMSPFTANYGFDPSAPLDLQLEERPHRDLPDHVARLQELHRYAKDTVTAAHARQAAYANQHRQPSSFAVGDTVRINAEHFKFQQQPCPKFRDRYVGPFTITRQVSPVAFEVSAPPGSRFHPVFHVSRLEKWTSDIDHLRDAAPRPLPIVSDATHEFLVESLLDVDFNSNRTGLLFNVRWAAPYDSPEHDTWEPLRHLSNTIALDVFLRSPAWATFASTKEFLRFNKSFPNRVPTLSS